MRESLHRYGPPLLLVAIAALLPVGRASELPILIAAVLGVVLVARRRIEPDALALPTLLFLGYWLPELACAPDALDRGKAWQEVAVDLRFLPLLWFATWSLRAPGALGLALRGVAAVTVAFALDGAVQSLTGFSLGGAATSDRLSGLFGADDLKLGPVLAVLSPIALLVAERRYGFAGLAIVFVLLLPVVLLAGARAGWLMFALGSALALAWRYGVRRAAALTFAGIAAAVAIGAVAQLVSERFAERIDRTAQALRGDGDGIDHALSHRLPIWRAAVEIGAEHPVNGVGVRGYRIAYPEHAAPDDRWVGAGETALHAHQIVLEVWAETGAIGLVCWLAAVVIAVRTWRRADGPARGRAAAPAVALVAMTFPLNTHYAFYSSFWSVLFFLLLALYVGALAPRARRA